MELGTHVGSVIKKRRLPKRPQWGRSGSLTDSAADYRRRLRGS
jgi:hypothetical protein